MINRMGNYVSIFGYLVDKLVKAVSQVSHDLKSLKMPEEVVKCAFIIYNFTN